MNGVDGFYLEEDNLKFIKENSKKRGDKSKLVNEAITMLRQKNLNKEKLKVIIQV